MKLRGHALVLSAILLSVRLAQAESAAAAALFEEGRQLLDAGKIGAACDKFAASHAEEPSVGALLNLGRCREQQGKPATAWADYRRAAELARQNGDSERVGVAEGMARTLEARGLPMLTIRVDSPVAGLMITRDSTVVDPGSLGLAVPVDPGKHVIQAMAPGGAAWASSVFVEPRAEVVVNIPPLGADDRADAATSEDSSPQAIAGWAAIGVGAAALTVGAIFGGLALADKAEADDLCPDKRCATAAGLELVDRAETEAVVSTIAMIAGGVLAAGGLTLVLTAPDGANQAAVSVTPFIGPLSGVALRF